MTSLKIGLVLLLCLSIVASKPVAKKKPPKKDLKLRLLNLLEEYVDKRSKASGNQVPEKDLERQTIHKNNGDSKPKNIKVDKKQADADNKDRHPTVQPPPPVNKRGGIETRNFGISTSRLWTDGVIPYEIDENFGSRLTTAVNLIQAMAAHISATTCVNWRLKTADDQYYVRIIGETSGCWSYVGNIKRDGGQPLGLGSGCLSEYVVLHEMQHAMGGLHEQQRDRRKYFVKINWENIRADYNNQYALSQHTKNNEPYDYRSILQYHLTAFTSNGKDTMTIADPDLEYLITNRKTRLSYYDKAEINKEYNCPTASCTLNCQNGGFRLKPLDQSSCSCQCPTGLKGATCEELDTDADCGGIINLSNGGSDEITMTSYTVGKQCTWLVKAETNSIMKATVTSLDLPFDSNNDCHHWLEFRDYLIGNDGKELCGQSTVPKTYTQTNIGEYSPFMIRFDAQNSFTPGTGFTIKVEAFQSGCMSSPCKTGSLCSENGGGGAYTCTCANGMSGTDCDEFRAPSYNFCDIEDDYGTCLFDQDNSGDIIWSFNTKLCDWRGCGSGVLTRGTSYQFLTLTPYYDSVQWTYGSKALIKTSATFTAVDRCLSFEYAIGNYASGSSLTQLNVYVEGTGKAKTNIKNIQTTTDYVWQADSVSIEAVENLVITIEGVIGPQLIGVDNISLRPGLCTNTPCNPNPCLNSGSCDESNPPEGTKYVCTCTSGYSGDRCEVQNTDFCANTPCKNGATCTSGSTTYSCQCDTGYTGPTCEATDYCANTPCKNGATCTSGSTTYSCQCDTGFTGPTCEVIDYCANTPCKNGATCTSGSTTFSCQCDTGYTGPTCEVTDFCANTPCKNGATCTSGSTTYSCQCDTGYTGPTCEVIDYCANTPCKNGATCTSGSTTFSCQCDTGYTGPTCEVTDFCANTPCKNGATCTSGSTTYSCQCDTGYTGPTCEVIDYCANTPCKNGATCTSGSTTFSCQCDTGYTGPTCEVTDFCANTPCKNGATCTSGSTTYSCQCDTGYTGPTCEVIDYCANTPCKNGATCTSGSTTFSCQCDTGYTGPTCEVTDFCANTPCKNGATCTSGSTTYSCQCDTGYTGPTCEVIDYCANTPCKNGATCTSGSTTFSCQCDTGYTGPTCEVTDFCANTPCKNGATCTSGSTTYSCQCDTGYTGPTCEATDYCANTPCKNGATCTSGSTTYSCQCDTGYMGPTCEVIDYCANTPCKNGATCTSGSTTFSCQCDTGYTGPTCEVTPCYQNECMNGATCEVDSTDQDGYRCNCDTGYTGDRCEDIDTGNPCDNNPCQNGGTCVETSGEDEPYRCDCRKGYPGRHCEGRSCTFEKKNDPACFLDTQDRLSYWRRRRGKTPSRKTGPRKAYEGNFYFYFEANRRTPGELYYFFDNGVLFEDKMHCLSLYYHMRGSGMGTFAIYTYKTSYEKHFEISGHQGNKWHKLELDLPLDEETYITVVAERGDTLRSDIAIDDVTLMPYPCSD